MQTAHAFKKTVSTTYRSNYLLFLPEDYDAKQSKRWPLIVFLHGSGERGSNPQAVAKHGPPKLVKTQPDFPFAVLSPQCPANETWSTGMVMAMIDEVTGKHAIDQSRIYLTGLSIGGYGAWALAVEHPERFAAAAPICGGGSVITMLLEDRAKARVLRKLPFWVFHGAEDEVVKLEESERMVKALESIGGNVRFTVYPHAKHDSWTETYNNPALYEWFLSHKKR